MKIRASGEQFRARHWLSILLVGAYLVGVSIPSLAGQITINKKENVVIDGGYYTNPGGDCLVIQHSKNITVRNAKFVNYKGVGIKVLSSHNILIEKNYFEKTASGVYAVVGSSIKVNNNEFKNVLGPLPRGQFVQYNKVYGAGNQVNYNNGVNLPGQSNPEDLINMYDSCGIPTDPIEIIGNRLTGGGPSTHGGGILAGDAGRGCYILIKENNLINPGQYGIGITGGHHVQIIDNYVYGKKQPFTNVGIYAYLWPKAALKTPCHSHTIQGNTVDWVNKAGKRNPRWTDGKCGPIIGWNVNTWK